MEYQDSSLLILPALRAHMGDQFYYIASMKMSDISKRVRYAHEVHPNHKLSELIQRSVEAGRAHGIMRYLLTQEQRFFNALVIGVYEGAPEWYELHRR